MFGREVRLPVDLCFGISPHGEEEVKYHQYVDKMKCELKSAYQLATSAATKNHQRNKRLYDARVRNQTLEVDDRVLIRNLGITGKHKLKDRWNPLPYQVIGKLPNLPVYRVKPEWGPGIVKTLHRDHLLPIGYMVRLPVISQEPTKRQRPVTRASRVERLEEPNESSQSQSVQNVCEDGASELEGEDLGTLPQFTFEHSELRDRLSKPGNNLPVQNETAPADDIPVPDVPAEEDRQYELFQREAAEIPLSPIHDPGVDPGLEGGDILSSSTMDGDEESVCECRTQRKVKPVIRLSYDEPGKPTDRPITIVHRGMIIQISYQ